MKLLLFLVIILSAVHSSLLESLDYYSSQPRESRDPCIDAECGEGAKCTVIDHQPTCLCPEDRRGDPHVGCHECESDSECANHLSNSEIFRCENPCNCIACGEGANCTVINHQPTCFCPEGRRGDPHIGCHECESDSECANHLSCSANFTCENPCSGKACGEGANCKVIDHQPTCFCPEGRRGDPHIGCHECESDSECANHLSCSANFTCENPCSGKACGEGANCKVIDHQPTCFCPEGRRGDPHIGCHECESDSECANHLSCSANFTCENPCSGKACGEGANCKVIDHQPTCFCPEGRQGDPHIGCHECESDSECANHLSCSANFTCENPCSGKACGEGANCKVIDHQPTCLCPEGWQGNPNTGCSPECTNHSDCSGDKPACIDQKCTNPCEGSCGVNANCILSEINLVCNCSKNVTENSSISCRDLTPDPCQPNPCGENAHCTSGKDEAGKGYSVCTCLPGYTGDAKKKCTKKGCESDSQCPDNKECINYFCQDTCSDKKCGEGAKCKVINHKPTCSCLEGWRGDPHIGCHECESDSECANHLSNSEIFRCENPCDCKACGEGANCTMINHQPTCLCPEGWKGDSLIECHECERNSDCPGDKPACIDQKCTNPCKGFCGVNAICELRRIGQKFTPSCSCPENMIGNPLDRCIDPCQPNPCGENANCTSGQDEAGKGYSVCTCLAGYNGDAKKKCTKKECESDSQCPDNKACINYSCKDPCSDKKCGEGAKCMVKNHKPTCHCPKGWQGDSLIECHECERNSDCPDNKPVCNKHKCTNPCEGSCGVRAVCNLKNIRGKFTPSCSCPNKMIGNPLNRCIPDPCQPNPCGGNANCTSGQNKVGKGYSVCKCLPGYTGDAKKKCIKKECESDSQCRPDKACINYSCKDPCIDPECGKGALCDVEKHEAWCRCPEGWQGNSLIECHECERNSDCPGDKPACIDQKCTNPCEGFCHGHNAVCNLKNIRGKFIPICRCPGNMFGNPLDRCIDPCQPDPCGRNTYCTLGQDEVGTGYPVCTCLPGYSVDAREECTKDECQSDSECLDNKACINYSCLNPCFYKHCSDTSQCRAYNHRANCECQDEYDFNLFIYD